MSSQQLQVGVLRYHARCSCAKLAETYLQLIFAVMDGGRGERRSRWMVNWKYPTGDCKFIVNI